MILTVTLNAAVDVTYEVDRLVPNSSHPVGALHARAGGKGINVARVLHTLGTPVTVTGLVGGPTGRQLRVDLAESGLRDELVSVDGDTRRTVTVVSREAGDATVFNERGPLIRPDEWADFTVRYRRLLRTAEVVVLSGSLPPGLPPDAYGQLVRAAAEAGCRTILDASGPALLHALDAGPDIVKPNAAELHAVTGEPRPLLAARKLLARGTHAVAASLGPDGLCAVTPEGTWRARPPEQLTGNPTGAGDACVAALARGLTTADDWPTLLREAVALSAAAVLAPLAGAFDPQAHRRFRTAVLVEEVHAPRHQP
ncbi:1-phosphofructokinase family hexose kinase [Kitasatospora sp. McL0602]|uniref:1-phosphofructokinase family hexose kinase n=1 Tax=Kitasatospora sp. McL0602 TaxID=3439530 RepID=UPI003F89728B